MVSTSVRQSISYATIVLYQIAMHKATAIEATDSTIDTILLFFLFSVNSNFSYCFLYKKQCNKLNAMHTTAIKIRNKLLWPIFISLLYISTYDQKLNTDTAYKEYNNTVSTRKYIIAFAIFVHFFILSPFSPHKTYNCHQFIKHTVNNTDTTTDKALTADEIKLLASSFTSMHTSKYLFL